MKKINPRLCRKIFEVLVVLFIFGLSFIVESGYAQKGGAPGRQTQQG